jgi:tetratricopeptide (TPR) repeat protein
MIVVLLFLLTQCIAGCSGPSDVPNAIPRPSVAIQEPSGTTQPPSITAQATHLPEQKPTEQQGREADILPSFETVHAVQTITSMVKKHHPLLDLRNLRNYLQGIHKQDLEPLSTPEAVEYTRELILSKLDLTDDDLEPVSHMKLERLTLDGNKIKDLRVIDNMTSLKRLFVHSMPLTPVAYTRIGRLRNLRVLDISSTPVSDADLGQLSKLQNLVRLNIENCKVTYPAIIKLQKALVACEVRAGQDPLPDTFITDKFKGEIAHHNYAETEQAINKFINKWQTQKSPDFDSLSVAYGLLGKCYVGQGRSVDALAAYKNAVDMGFGPFPVRPNSKLHMSIRSDALDEYAILLEKQNLWNEEVKLRCRIEQVALSQENTGSASTRVWQTTRAYNAFYLGESYGKLMRYRDAAKAKGQAAIQFETIGGDHFVQAIQSLIGEANFLEKTNDLNGCRKCYLKADRLLPIAKNYPSKAVLAALKAQIEKGLSKPGTKL